MKKLLTLFASIAALVAAFADLRGRAQGRHDLQGEGEVDDAERQGVVQLENGQSLQIDPTLIDVAKSEQPTKLGLGDASITPSATRPATAPQAAGRRSAQRSSFASSGAAGSRSVTRRHRAGRCAPRRSSGPAS